MNPTPASIGPESIAAPDFGTSVQHRAEACTPSELYQALVNAEDHSEYLEPAFTFALRRVTDPELPDAPETESSSQFIEVLVEHARDEELPAIRAGYSSSWPVRVVAEFAPTGLIDGAWLQGLTSVCRVEDRVGMLVLKQFMIRCGDPGSSESYAARYESLLKSVGIVPAGFTRWELKEAAPCLDLSYEHALLGLSLGLFPGAMRPEIVGFNLWMATIGPCPVLSELADGLRAGGAALRYLDAHDASGMATAAVGSAVQLVSDAPRGATRLANGFFAAQRSYVRWRTAVCGANVPMTPRDCVVEIVGRKARFAVGHHGQVRLASGRTAEEYFAGDRTDHEAFVDELARSPYVRRGQPEHSRLVNASISIDGPMFDIFTASEQRVLREWISGLDSDSGAVQPLPVALSGHYGPPQDGASLRRYAAERFRTMDRRELMFHLVNADQCPPVRAFARSFAEQALDKVRSALKRDPRLGGSEAPPYSQQAVAAMVVLNHSRNVDTQDRGAQEPSPPSIAGLLDGCWLQGFANVGRVDREEYGWLFRIYASEMGDGNLEWNHNHIARQMYAERLATTVAPASDRGLYDHVAIGMVPLVYMSMALHTGRFLPELLGLNLAIEARGVCGWYVPTWKHHERAGDQWAALYHRLHNSIDNYASGHTKWSLAAVQAYMSRLSALAPEVAPSHWQRIWELWRLLEIQAHGTPAEQKALQESLGPMAHESFVPSIA